MYEQYVRRHRQPCRNRVWAVAIVSWLVALSPLQLPAQNAPEPRRDASSTHSGQETASDKERSESSSAIAEGEAGTGRVQYVGPDTYILLDAEGRPQAMPGMT